MAGTIPWANSAFDRLLPRALVPVAHKPLISYGLSWLLGAGISRVTVCGNRQTRVLEAQLGHHIPCGMTYSYLEDPMPRGAAGCVRDAADGDPGDTYVVTDGCALPNTIDLTELLRGHHTSGAEMTVVVCPEPGRHGAPGPVVPVGIFVVNHTALDSIPPHGFFDIKEHLIAKLYRAGGRVGTYEIPDVVPRVLDAQTYLAVNGRAVASVVSGDAVPPGYHKRGESVVHADARVAEDALLAGPVLIGQGAEIHAGAVVIGPTSIGCDVVINGGALVSRSAAWRRSVVPAGMTMDLCILGDGAVIRTNGHALATAGGRTQLTSGSKRTEGLRLASSEPRA